MILYFSRVLSAEWVCGTQLLNLVLKSPERQSMSVLKQFLVRRLHDVWIGCRTAPRGAVWWRCVVYYVVFAACALPIGFASGLLRFEILPWGPGALLRLVAYLFISPALIEEIVFRGSLLPQDSGVLSRRRLLALCSVSLGLFVLSHVVNGLLFHRGAVGVFTNPWFLLEAALLGAVCIAAYLKSGSVWPGVVAHWLTVAVWIVLFGGGRLVGLAGAGPL